MKRNVVETVFGGVVLLVAASFLIYGYQVGDVSTPDGYEVTAEFSNVGGLKPGDDVRIGGVRVGSVTDVGLDQNTYLAIVHVGVDSDYKIPTDTVALISSESLLGGRYLSLQPGAEEDMLEDGGRIQYTQAPQNLEELLGQFIFNAQNNDDKSE